MTATHQYLRTLKFRWAMWKSKWWFCIAFCVTTLFLHFSIKYHNGIKKERPIQDIYIASVYSLERFEIIENKYTVRGLALAPYNLRDSNITCTNHLNESVTAKITNMGNSLESCTWWEFFIDCSFETSSNSVILSGSEKDTQIEVPVKQPVQHSYKLMVCFARMFMYDNWRMLITALEMYLHHGVELFSIPIVSVVKEVYEVLRIYEDLGIVRMTGAVVMPKLENDFNPNTRTEFFNQVVCNTECLYEYRNSEFILMIDYDDIVLPKDFANLYEEAQMLSRLNPTFASFEYLRDEHAVIQFDTGPYDWNFSKILKSINPTTDPPYAPGKSVIIPSKVQQGFIHRPLEPNQMFPHEILTTDSSILIHFRRQLKSDDVVPILNNRSYVHTKDYSVVEQNFLNRLSQNKKLDLAFKFLPTKLNYFEYVMGCYRKMYLTNAYISDDPDTYCPSLFLCDFSDATKTNIVYSTCTQLKNTYESVKINNHTRIHYARNRIFTDTSTCFDTHYL